ncbi:MAG: DUF6455 family protein [Bosea sp. (in: a-proteobacteria)]|uniref:DUF6455 family protein n=1 Tax=Bosea sp. (in: a-proteobacteria) TaxID=1871050 RepID=UPI003F7C383B
MSFARSARHWLNAKFPTSDVNTLDRETISQLARDNVMSAADLCALARQKGSNAGLLERQLARAGLDLEAAADMSVIRDMQIVCAGCSMTSRCRRSLNQPQVATNYAAYCPNALTIDALSGRLS